MHWAARAIEKTPSMRAAKAAACPKAAQCPQMTKDKEMEETCMPDHETYLGVTGKYTTNGTPHGYTAITPFIVVDRPAEAIAFYEAVFGARAKNVRAVGAPG